MIFDADGADLRPRLVRLIVAGWTGRDDAAVRHHIDELSALGVTPPSAVPLFYRASASLLTQAETIQVLGPDTSGEVEPLLIHWDGRLWLGLGSDHTDRELEAVSVAASKQACPKPVADQLWPFDAVAGHLDQLLLRCEISEAGTWVTYQDGPLLQIRPLGDLAARAGLSDGDAMLCGTLGARGGVRPATAYRMALIDPVRDRVMRLDYRIEPLPVVT